MVYGFMGGPRAPGFGVGRSIGFRCRVADCGRHRHLLYGVGASVLVLVSGKDSGAVVWYYGVRYWCWRDF